MTIKLEYFCTESKMWFKMSQRDFMGENRPNIALKIPCCSRCNYLNGISKSDKGYTYDGYDPKEYER